MTLEASTTQVIAGRARRSGGSRGARRRAAPRASRASTCAATRAPRRASHAARVAAASSAPPRPRPAKPGQQPEGGDLDVVAACAELRVADRLALEVAEPRLDAGLAEVRAPARGAPAQPVRPVPRPADPVVEAAAERRVGRVEPPDLEALDGARRPQLLRARHLEVPGRDRGHATPSPGSRGHADRAAHRVQALAGLRERGERGEAVRGQRPAGGQPRGGVDRGRDPQRPVVGRGEVDRRAGDARRGGVAQDAGDAAAARDLQAHGVGRARARRAVLAPPSRPSRAARRPRRAPRAAPRRRGRAPRPARSRPARARAARRPPRRRPRRRWRRRGSPRAARPRRAPRRAARRRRRRRP